MSLPADEPRGLFLFGFSGTMPVPSSFAWVVASLLSRAWDNHVVVDSATAIHHTLRQRELQFGHGVVADLGANAKPEGLEFLQ